MESFGDFALSLTALSALVPGVVQTFKELLGWEGTKARALTMFVGMFFGGLFCAYAIYRANSPEVFVDGHRFLDKPLGAANTVVLIFSSLTMAMAVRAAQLGRRRAHRHGCTGGPGPYPLHGSAGAHRQPARNGWCFRV